VAAPVLVQVVGLRALNRDLGRLCADAGPLYASLREAGRGAVQPVASAVSAAWPRTESYKRAAGTMAGTVRVTATRSGAAVREGYARLPYAGPIDFGWPKRNIDFVRTGRYMFPAAEPLRAVAASRYSEATTAALASFGWTNETAVAEGIHD
jgi:hypothetical protein